MFLLLLVCFLGFLYVFYSCWIPHNTLLWCAVCFIKKIINYNFFLFIVFYVLLHLFLSIYYYNIESHAAYLFLSLEVADLSFAFHFSHRSSASPSLSFHLCRSHFVCMCLSIGNFSFSSWYVSLPFKALSLLSPWWGQPLRGDETDRGWLKWSLIWWENWPQSELFYHGDAPLVLVFLHSFLLLSIFLTLIHHLLFSLTHSLTMSVLSIPPVTFSTLISHLPLSSLSDHSEFVISSCIVLWR